MDNRTKKILEEINRVKKERLDIANAPKTGREGWRKIFDHVQFMSIYDMINMVKSGAEDIQRIWKRRGESVQSSVGEMLTGWISDKVPYAGRLKHEYHRRSKDSEVEEIEQWKKAFKEVDSYELHEILAKTRNADQTRAIIELLSERGRLDWNDKGLWRTLNALSHYTMPEAACEEDDLLRDRWIQKLITDIWSDKDHYYNWRRQNDDNFESGKKQFTSVTDQLSNIQGGLAAELKSMLEKFVAARTNEESIPEEVNPQKYEEILHYSIRNGKMSMQDKLFYLVQGIRHGLLTIDRLRVMAGEKGEILNLFPFIDYFYGHNNSMHEITALGKRLEESGDPFKPGAKTTMWLHMELLRDKKAQERMSKALSGTRAEQIDHEDFPTLVSNMSYANINEMTGVLSGTRYKISYEAAKNAYTGFGTKFKILATLAELDSKGQARFTEKDAAEAAKSIAAYIHMDNTFTGNTTDGNNRIKLSWDQIHEPGPSTSGLNVKEYRDGNGGFIQDILSGFSSSIDWNAMKDGNLVKNELVRSKAEEKKETIISDEDNRKKRNFVAMGEFSRQLAKAIMTNPDILKGILRSHRNNFLEENFADTSKPDEKRHINVNGMRKYMDSRT
jgi:hypothetical protein